jgi:hypothetical protein
VGRLNDQLGDKRGESEWEPSSPKRWTRLCPKITSKGSHAWTSQGHIVTTDLPTLEASPNKLQSGSTTQASFVFSGLDSDRNW